MHTLRIHKVVANLPTRLEPDAVYAVRNGGGFDLYISDQTGRTAHRINMAAAEIERMQRYVQSRGSGLVSNGSGLMRDNTNFSRFSFDPTDLFSGYGCFTTAVTNFDGAIDELIPVNPLSSYELSFAARTKIKTAATLAYSYLACCDMDGIPITPDRLVRLSFRLAERLTSGQTAVKIHPEDVDKVALYLDACKGRAASVQLISSRYTSASGYSYQPNTYSRIRYTNGNALLTALRLSGNTLTGLTLAAGVSLSEGETVCLSMADATYLYGMSKNATEWSANRDLHASEIPEAWTDYRMRFRLTDMLPVLRRSHPRLADTSVYPNIGQSMAAATAGIKIGWLLNRGTQTGNASAISAINFREV